MLFGAGSAAVPAPPAQAFCRLTTDMPLPTETCSQAGVGLEWRRSCISYSLTRRPTDSPPFEAMRDVADLSFRTWTEASCSAGPIGLEVAQTVELATCEEPEYNTRGPNANSILFVEDWRERELPLEAFGLTLVWHDPEDGEIFDADMQINETLGRLDVCGSSCSEPVVDLQNVMTHEVGHFLGLGHTRVRGATMSASAHLGETAKRSLEPDDLEGVCSIYARPDAPRCIPSDFQPDRGFTAECGAGRARVKACGCTVPGASVAGIGARWMLLLLGVVLLARALPRRRRKAPC